MTALIANLGPTELIIILVIVVLLFGASKLPELARGSGRALRIFKAETQGLADGGADHGDDKAADADDYKTPEQLELDRRQAELDAERRAYEQQPGDTTP